jgi:hypothetical protein
MALAESPAPGRCCGLDHYALLTMMPRFGAAIMPAAIGSTMHPETFRGYEYCASVEKRRFGFHTGFRRAYGLAPQDIRQYRTDMHARHNRL